MILNNSPKANRAAKQSRWEMLKQAIANIGKFFTELFPNKQRDVLDEIVYMTAATGIAKIGAAKLAKNAEASERTVSTVVHKLKKTGEYLIARIGRAGKYVFIDAKHPNFHAIIDFLFDQDAPLVASSLATPIANPVATPEFPESPVAQGFDQPKESLNDINGFNVPKYLDNKDNADTEKSPKVYTSAKDKHNDLKNLCLDEYLKKIPAALHNITLFSQDVPTLYDMVGAIFRGKNSVAVNVRLEDHEQLCANKINELYEYYMRQVEDIPDYDVYGLLNTGFAKLTTAIVAGTAYDVQKQEIINGVSEQMIEDETDPVKKQQLIDQRAGKMLKSAPKKPIGKTEIVPDWMEDNQRHWEAKEAARKEALDKRIEEMGGLEAYRQHVLAKIGLA